MVNNFIKKSVFFVVSFFYLFISFLGAKEIILGGKNGWSSFESQENIASGQGRYGYDCIQLASNSFRNDIYTDLFINFEDLNNLIAEGDYSVHSNSLQLSSQSKMEKYAGLSRNIGGLSVFGQPGTFLGSEGIVGSFSIEFWLCPSLAENGEVILNWESSKNVNGKLLYQILNATFNKGHLEWNLTNLFESYTPNQNLDEITLKGTSTIIPDQWSYHVLSYDCESGYLEYIVNGFTEDFKYMTSNGQENGEIALVSLGNPAELTLCQDFTGKIDDFRIVRHPYSVPEFQSSENAGKIGNTRFVPNGGKFVTKPIMVSTGSNLNSISAEVNIPEQTAILFYVRSGDYYFNWTKDYPEWVPVENNQQLKGITGLYFQLAAELYPDGEGEVSPSITQIVLDYTELPEPLAPFVVKAQAGNGCVTVSWNYSVDDTAGGYYLYYGNRPGEYLGRVALEGQSPINVGNTTSFTLTGLENGKIYYFAVATWSAYDDRVIGKLSKEVYARPLARLK